MLAPGVFLLIGSVAGGWLFAKAFNSHRIVRFLLSVVLGLSFFTAGASLISLLAPVHAAWGVALVATVAVGYLYRTTPHQVDCPIACPGPKESAFVLLLAITGWLYACGSQQLFPSQEYLLWHLPKFMELGSGPAGPGFLSTAALFGRDPWLATVLASAVVQVTTLLGCYLFALLAWPQSVLVRITITLYLAMSTPRGLLIFEHPWQTTANLWLMAGLIFLTTDRRWPGWFLVAACTTLSWPHALALAVALVPWSQKLRFQAGLLGLLYAILSKPVALPWILAAVLVIRPPALLLRRPDQATLRFLPQLALIELWGPSYGVFGLAAGALVITLLLQEQWNSCTDPGRPRLVQSRLHLPSRWFLSLAFLALVVLGGKAGETVFNDQVLIASQKERVNFLRLVRPHSLSDWLSWRGERLGFTSQDASAVEEIRKTQGKMAYFSGPFPDPEVSALVATLAQKPLLGWSSGPSGPELAAPLSAYLLSEQTDLLTDSGLDWLFQRNQPPIAITPSVSGKPVSPVALKARVLGAETGSLPANSLIPLRLKLSNAANYRVVTDTTASARFELRYLAGDPRRGLVAPLTPLALPTLEPGQEEELTVYLRTPPKPCYFQLELFLVTADGGSKRVPLEGVEYFRTWFPGPPLEVDGGARHYP